MHSASINSTPLQIKCEIGTIGRAKDKEGLVFQWSPNSEASTMFSHFCLDKSLFSTLKLSFLYAGCNSSREQSLNLPLTHGCHSHMQGPSKILDLLASK